jgi:RNA polymerase sigma factor (sigma-70 family)
MNTSKIAYSMRAGRRPLRDPHCRPDLRAWGLVIFGEVGSYLSVVVCDPIETQRVDLTAFHEGRAEVVRQIYLEHGARLLRELRTFTGPAEAEAVVHDVFVELIRNQELRTRFTGGSLLAWLRQIARLKGFEHLRRARRDIPKEQPPERAASPEPELEARDVLQRFVNVMVPEKQRDFFTLRFLETHTQVEVATKLGIARSTLEGWEHTLVEKLRTFVLEGS